jgi:protein-disulfide isomerase
MDILLPPFDKTKDHYSGLPSAPVELVEYGDFQCEHCADVYPVIKLLQQSMGSQLKFVYRHFPLHKIHPLAWDAAITAEAATLQDKFWLMHDTIFENQKYLSRASLLRFSDELGLDSQILEDSRKHKYLYQKLVSDYESGIHSGVDGTPTLFINRLQYDGFHDFNSLYSICQYLIMYNNRAALNSPAYPSSQTPASPPC